MSLPSWISDAPATRTFWVSPDGNNTTGDGSYERPWQTINYAVNRPFIGAGDEIVVRPGTYVERVLVYNQSGSPDAQLTIRSEIPGEALIQAPADSRSAVHIRTNHVTFDGFEVTGGNGGGIGVHGTHVRISNNIVRDNGENGIWANRTEFVLIEGNTVSNSATTGVAHNSGISIYQARNVTEDTTTPGFRIIIRNNISHGNYSGPEVLEPHTDGNGIIIDDLKSNQTEGFPSYAYPTLVENNLVYGNGGKGIHVFSSEWVTVRNNTVAFNNWDNLAVTTSRGDLSNVNSDNTTWINNIAVADTTTNPHNTAIASTGGTNENIVWENNLTFNGTTGATSLNIGKGNAVPSAEDGNLLGVDPKFVDAAGADFSLLPDSPALEAGTAEFGLSLSDLDGGLRAVGTVDIGAYEMDAPADPDEDPDVQAFKSYWQGLADAGRISAAHAAEVIELFEDGVTGTLKVISGPGEGNVTSWLFENTNKSILFLAADDNPPGQIALDLSGMDPQPLAVWADGVDGGQAYAATPDADDAGRDAEISLTFDTPFEFMRLAFARTEQGEAEIDLVSDADRVDLAVLGQDGGTSASDDSSDDGDDGDDDDDDDDDFLGISLELVGAIALGTLLFLVT